MNEPDFQAVRCVLCGGLNCKIQYTYADAYSGNFRRVGITGGCAECSCYYHRSTGSISLEQFIIDNALTPVPEFKRTTLHPPQPPKRKTTMTAATPTTRILPAIHPADQPASGYHPDTTYPLNYENYTNNEGVQRQYAAQFLTPAVFENMIAKLDVMDLLKSPPTTFEFSPQCAAFEHVNLLAFGEVGLPEGVLDAMYATMDNDYPQDEKEQMQQYFIAAINHEAALELIEGVAADDAYFQDLMNRALALSAERASAAGSVEQ